MKNKLTLTFATAIILFAGLGCGVIDKVQKTVTGSEENGSTTSSNKTITDKAVDVAVGDEKIGIPECDEVMDFFSAEANNPDDDFVTKAVKATILNKMKEQFKKSLEENKTNKADLAKTCKEFKVNLDKYKEEQRKKQEAKQ